MLLLAALPGALFFWKFFVFSRRSSKACRSSVVQLSSRQELRPMATPGRRKRNGRRHRRRGLPFSDDLLSLGRDAVVSR